MLRLVLDSNIFISALLHRRGTPGRLIELWRLGAFELVVSDQLLAEVERVLQRPKFASVGEADIGDLLALLRDGALTIPDPAAGEALTGDPNDDYVVRLARAARAHAIVSGDVHLTELSADVCRVLTPRDAVELLES